MADRTVALPIKLRDKDVSGEDGQIMTQPQVVLISGGCARPDARQQSSSETMTRRFKHPQFRNESDLVFAIETLGERCPHMARAYLATGVPPMRPAEPTFAGLIRIIVAQQVSTASANAIWQRVSNGIVPFDAGGVLDRDAAALAALGLSRPKVATVQAIAAAVQAGELDLDTLNTADDAHIVETLTRVRGIGPWTANIYLLFALRRCDAFPAGDLALQIGAQRLMRLKARPDADRLTAIAERWRPYRGAAARLLWAHYATRPASGSPSPNTAKTRKHR